MALILLDIGGDGTNAPPYYDGQAVPDACDWQAERAATGGSATSSEPYYNAGRSGLLWGCAVTAHGGGTMAVDVAAGEVIINGTVVQVAAQTNIAVATADPAVDRKDVVTIDTSGVAHSSGLTAACKGTINISNQGANWTKSSTTLPPVKPPIPSNQVLLSEVYVPVGLTSISLLNLTDKSKKVTLGQAELHEQAFRLGVTGGITVLAESQPRETASTSYTMTNGTAALTAIALPGGLSIGKVGCCVVTIGASFSSAHSWMAVLDANRNVLATTADRSAAWAAGSAAGALSGTGLYYDAIAAANSHVQSIPAVDPTSPSDGSSVAQSTMVTPYTGKYYLAYFINSGGTPTMPVLAGGNTAWVLAAFAGNLIVTQDNTARTTPIAIPGAMGSTGVVGARAWGFVAS